MQATNLMYEGHCLCLFVHLFPGEPTAHNYKINESAIAMYLKEKFPNVTWGGDKRIKGGCSMRRSDLFLDMSSHLMIVEVDFHQLPQYV